MNDKTSLLDTSPDLLISLSVTSEMIERAGDEEMHRSLIAGHVFVAYVARRQPLEIEPRHF